MLAVAAAQAFGVSAEKIADAERVMWSRFFVPKTKLFYECLNSFDEKTCQSHLPTAEEVGRQYPNPCGYATGMEDCAILGGTVLAALADKYEMSPDPQTAARAKLVAEGLESLVLPDGFVARGLCVEDGRSVYINSSVDQYTHCIHGLWKYCKSAVSDAEGRGRAKNALIRIAERLRRNVVAENDFDSLRLDGKPCALRISRFTTERPHVAARLSMAYAAAWDVSGKPEYYSLYRSGIGEAVAVSERIKIAPYTPIYSFLQMQISLELLRETESDPALKSRIEKLMSKLPKLCAELAPRLEKRFDDAELETPYGDWRKPEKTEVRNGYNIPKLGKSRDVWRTIRDTGEIALVAAIAPRGEIPEPIESLYEKAVAKIDYDKCASCGAIYHWAAFMELQKRAKKLSVGAR